MIAEPGLSRIPGGLMRHRKSRLRLSGSSDHAQAVLRNLAISLITHGRIKTTVKRAKVLRPFLEKIITLSRRCASAADYSTRDHLYRIICERLHDRKAAAISTRVWGPYYLQWPGGYTRILRAGFRVGDNAELAIIEFVIAQEHESVQIRHSDLLSTFKTYKPKGVGLLEAWRSIDPPRIDLKLSDQRGAAVAFTVEAEISEDAAYAFNWPKFRGRHIPMELTVSVLAPKTGSHMWLKTDEAVGLPARAGRITIRLEPDTRRSHVEGFVSLEKVPINKRYCSVAVDSPAGEVFHATLIE